MLKLIHADFYKSAHRPAFYIILTVLPLFAVLLVLFVIRGRNAGTMTGAFDVAPQILAYPTVLIPLVTELTMGEELRERTIKNSIEYGTGRALYFSAKLVSTVLFGALLMLLVFGAYFAAAALSLPQGQGVSPELAQATFRRIGAAFAVYIAAFSVSIFFLSVFNRSVLAIFAYYGAIYLTAWILPLFRLKKLADCLLNSQLTALTAREAPQYGFILAVSAVTLLLFYAGGLAVLKKKDLA